MKDGQAHPSKKSLCWSKAAGEWVRLTDIPTVETTELGEQNEHRAATELERIADRYPDTNIFDGKELPSRDAASAQEILEAARLLYIELYRDCGAEVRRQKLKGAYLLQRWLEKEIWEETLTTEEKERCRAYMVLDTIELGVKNGPPAFEAAAAVAEYLNWRLGKEKSFENAYRKHEKHPDWLTSGHKPLPYRKITRDDLEDVGIAAE